MRSPFWNLFSIFSGWGPCNFPCFVRSHVSTACQLEGSCERGWRARGWAEDCKGSRAKPLVAGGADAWEEVRAVGPLARPHNGFAGYFVCKEPGQKFWRSSERQPPSLRLFQWLVARRTWPMVKGACLGQSIVAASLWLHESTVQCKETSMLLLFDGGSRSNRQLIESRRLATRSRAAAGCLIGLCSTAPQRVRQGRGIERCLLALSVVKRPSSDYQSHAWGWLWKPGRMTSRRMRSATPMICTWLTFPRPESCLAFSGLTRPVSSPMPLSPTRWSPPLCRCFLSRFQAGICLMTAWA